MTVRNPIVWIGTYFSMLPSGDQMQFPVGSAALPGIVFRGAATTGLYYTTTQLNVSVAGVQVGFWSATALNAIGQIQQGGNTVVDTNGLIHLKVYTVATLPATPPNGVVAFVSDSTQTLTAGIGTAVVGGGANNVPVYSDAGTWKIG